MCVCVCLSVYVCEACGISFIYYRRLHVCELQQLDKKIADGRREEKVAAAAAHK